MRESGLTATAANPEETRSLGARLAAAIVAVDWPAPLVIGLSGDLGDDTVSGGAGADIFHIFGQAGLDRVTDFNRAEGDQVFVGDGSRYTVSQVGGDVVIDLAGGARMVLANVSLSSLSDGWIVSA